MNLILNTNELGYTPFLNTHVNSFIVGLKSFCVNQKYSLNIKEIKEAIKILKTNNKQIYLSINLLAKENDIKKLKRILPKLTTLNIDGFVISDLGVLNLFKTYNLENKVVLDLHTYVTNKYSAKSLLDLGINKISLSKEITLEDILEISSFNKSKVNILVQGYVPITYSNRSILSRYYSKYKLKKSSSAHYIKEESRDNYYHLDEKNNNLIVYNDKQYSLFPYLLELINANIDTFQIDANLLSEDEISNYINLYNEAIAFIKDNKKDEYKKLKENFLNTYTFSNPFLHNESFLLKEGK